MSSVTIRAPRAVWLHLLTAAHKLTGAGKPVPIFGCARIQVDAPDRLEWAATDSETWRVGRVGRLGVSSDESVIEATGTGAGLLPVGALLPVLKSLPDGLIALAVDATTLKITAGKFRASVPTLPVLDFPPVPACDMTRAVTLPAPLLDCMIAIAQPCVHRDSAKYWARGVRFDLGEAGITCAASDGHKLAHVHASDPAVTDPTHAIGGDVLPGKGLTELRALLANAETVQHLRDEFGRHWFAVGAECLGLLCIQDKFPDILRAVPKAITTTVVADRALLLALVRRVGLMTADAHPIRIAVEEGALASTALSAAKGQADDALEIDHTGAPVVIGLNPDYLAELLEVLGSESVQIDFAGDRSPVRITPAAGQAPMAITLAVAPMALDQFGKEPAKK